MRNFSLLTVITMAFLSRFLPHPPNMTAIGALALFSGFAVRPRLLGLVLPLLVLLLTDYVIGFHNTMLFTYGAWSLLALAAMYGLKKFTWLKLGLASLGASAWFFVVTNFGVWFVGGLYPKTGNGLVECFVAAVPFFGNQMLGDLMFSAILFGLWMALEKRVPSLQPSTK